MTDFQNIKLETKNHIAYITIDRPKVLNALNMATMQEIKQAFASIKDDADVRVVILTGAGEKAFVAGADIGELSQHTPVSAKAYTHQGQAIIDAIENLGKPVIACINGFALGGGCEIAHGLHHASGQRECQARPARGEARPHPRLRRHAAPATAGGEGNRHATGADRRDDQRAGSASHRVGE